MLSSQYSSFVHVHKVTHLTLVITAIIFLISPLSMINTISTATQSNTENTNHNAAETQSAGLSSRTSDDYQFLIIVPQAWEDIAQKLANWKEMQGIKTEVVTVEYVESVSSGPDLGAKIQYFLRQEHTRDSELTYVLLYGDTEFIPTRMMYVGAGQYGLYDSIPSDFYYSALDTNWDGDMDGVYGEDGAVDYVPDVALGRIPASSHSEAQGYYNKIMNYEKDPTPNENYGRALLVGSLMWAPLSEDYQSWKDNAYKVQSKVRNILKNNMTLTEMYDLADLNGGTYIPESNPNTNDNLTHDALLAEYNKGASIVNFVTQGFENGNGLADYSGDGYSGDAYQWSHLFYYTDAQSVTNSVLPFVYVSSCNSGNFSETDDTDLEQLITNPNGGAIGLIAATQLSWRGETPNGTGYGNWWLNERFWHIFSNGCTNPALAMLELKKEYYQEKYLHPGGNPTELIVSNQMAYNYMGDPTVDVWTRDPATPTLASPAAVYAGSNTYAFKISAPEMQTYNATLIMDRPYHAVKKFSSTGTVAINLNLSEGDHVDFAVWGHNLRYSTFNLTAKAVPPDLYVGEDDITLPDSISFNTPVSILARIHCTSATAPPVKVGLYNGDTLLDSAYTPQLQADTSALITFHTEFNAPGTYHLKVIVDSDSALVEGSEDNNAVEFDVTVGGPDIVVWSPSLNPYPTEGRATNITIHVSNNGSTAVSDVIVGLFAEDTDTAPALPTQTVSALASGEDTEVTFQIDVDGQKGYYLWADPFGSITETNEANNKIFIAFNINEPPDFISIPTLELTEDTPAPSVLMLSDYCTDDSLLHKNTYMLVSSGPGINVIVDGNGSVSIVPDKDFSGNSSFVVMASDGVVSDTAQVNVNVNPVNDAPVPEWTFKHLIAKVGDTLHVQLNATDADGDKLSYSAEGAHVDRDGTITFQATADKVGDNNISISITDGNDTVYAHLLITVVSVNHPPVVNSPGTVKTAVGKHLILKIEASDPDGDQLTFSTDSTMFIINRTTGVIDTTLKEAQVGTHKITVHVSDGKNTTSTSVVIVVEKAPKSSPAYSALAAVLSVFISVVAAAYMRRRKQ